MDTSEAYIKMRIKAIPELGMGVPPHIIPYNFLTDTVYVDSIGNFYCIYQQGKDDAVIGCQLERQDQLQEMILVHWQVSSMQLVGDFVDFMTAKNLQSLSYPASMEQLWLAFVVKRIYNKVWNGDEWTE